MKLGGLTWWRNNYGSILQAYALQQSINSMPEMHYEVINQYGKKIASADNLLDKLKTIGIVRTIQRAFWKFAIPQMRRRNIKIQQFVDERLTVSEQQYTEESIYDANDFYDGFICGSDQIWNPELSDLDSMYWLDFVEREKVKIAYAPSIGVSSVNGEQKEKIRVHLDSFRAISCREKTGCDLIDQIMGKSGLCKNVLDPTLMTEKRYWDEISDSKVVEGDYIFVYMLRGTKAQRKIIERFANRKKLKIVTIPFLEAEHAVWYDLIFGDVRLWDASPEEFISAIRYASFIFTDSFHSTVFSCLYHIPFFNFEKIGNAQATRVASLLSLLEIDGRNVKIDEDVLQLEKKHINWERADLILQDKRNESQSYLRKALEINE